jgi:hypothetical protein
MLFSIELQKAPDLEAPRPAQLVFSAPNEQGEAATRPANQPPANQPPAQANPGDSPETGSSFFKR